MTDSDLIAEFLALPRYAVVGVSADETKYGYKIWRNLQKKGYTVYPINPNYDKIEGETCYESLAKVADEVDVVDIVVPPEVTLQIVRQCAELGLKRVWMQPGAESEEAIRFCHENDIKVLHDVCVMAESSQKEES